MKLRRFIFLQITATLWGCVLVLSCCTNGNARQTEQTERPQQKQHSILELEHATPKARSLPLNSQTSQPPAAEPRPATAPSNANEAAENSDDEILSEDDLDGFNQLVTRLALQAIPHTYTNDKDWGGQDERWNGIRLRRDDDGRLETERKWKTVNHGTWKKYSASLINPEEDFSIEVQNFHETEDGKLGFELLAAANLSFNARRAKWAKGVQLYSITAEGSGRVQLRVHCEMGVNLDFDNFPPDLIFEPVVTSADITVEDFRIDRVSKLGGEFAQQITRAARKILDGKISDKEADLVEKINNEIEEEGELRLEIGSSKHKWADEAMQFLPGPVQQALNKSTQNEDAQKLP